LHDLTLAEAHCDAVQVLSGGRLAAEGPPDLALSAATLAHVFQIARAERGAFRRL
jgi:iron complex transport system ATP-binding protein